MSVASAQPAPLRFWGPALRLVVLFVFVGPYIGALAFWPALFAFAPSEADAAVAGLDWFALVFGHSFALFIAYLLGIGPAVGTAFVLALYDRFGGHVLPRSLAAAFIGAALALAVCYRIAALADGIDIHLRLELDDYLGRASGNMFSAASTASVQQAFVLSGAIAACVCSLFASLLGLRADPQDAA